MGKKLIAMLLAAVFAVSLTACGETEFDAKGYVQGILDAKYQRNYTKYAEDLGVSEEEAKEQLESDFYNALKEQVASLGLTATDEELDRYFQIEMDARGKVKYEVQDAVKDDDGNYTVDVIVTPIDAYAELEDTISAKLQEAAENGADESAFMGVFLDCIESSVANAKELEPQTVTLHVTYEESDNQKIWSVPDDDVMNLDMLVTGGE